jgi:hypothetical protein
MVEFISVGINRISKLRRLSCAFVHRESHYEDNSVFARQRIIPMQQQTYLAPGTRLPQE